MYPDQNDVSTLIRAVAETEILPRFNRLSKSDISEKAPGDLVTIADTEAEKALSRGLTELLPDSIAIGEEGVAADPSSMNAIAGDTPVWIIDPVDGTHNFAHGTSCFAVIVSLVHNSRTVAGWIHDPIANTTIYGALGGGAWEEGERLTLLKAKAYADMAGSLKRSSRHKLADRRTNGEAGLPDIVKRYRCVGREYMDLARGKLDFASYGGLLKPWDHSAGILIYKEAGGFEAMIDTGCDYRVEPHIPRGDVMLAPNKDTWDELSELIKGA